MAFTENAPACDLAIEVLQALSLTDKPLTSTSAFPDVPFEILKAALDRLSSRSLISYKQEDRQEAILEPEAESIVRDGSHEVRVFEAVRKALDGLSIQELEARVGDKNVAKIGQGKAFREKWIKKDGSKLLAMANSVHDITREQLTIIKEKRTHENPTILVDLKKRKLLKMQKVISFTITKGDNFALQMTKEDTDLTAEMLASGYWKTANFKPYNFQALGMDQNAGAIHPLNKVRESFRHIFFELGFEEMPTQTFVESGFWNFDTLFVPQSHPARDLQDTFYLKDPARAAKPKDLEYLENVRQIHENGKYGSIGYRSNWTEDESLRLVLRTHTTATSSKMLYKLAHDSPNGRPSPARFFSIDRVFRNEAVDMTHLCEFHQVEGVIADYNLSLGGLMEFMESFFGKMGLTNLKFKPAYNPYTEPSMEIFSYHEGLAKLIEIGNSGMFRVEMLRALGLPEDMRVFGFGLSLERPTMIKFGISNIRELLGHQVDLGLIRKSPAVRLEKD